MRCAPARLSPARGLGGLAFLALGCLCDGCSVDAEAPAGGFRVSPAALAFEGPAEFSSAPLFQAIEGWNGSHGASIVAFDDGALLAAWYSYEGPHELDGAAIYLARRGPAESAWSAPQLQIDRPAGDANPVLYAEDDQVWLFQCVAPARWGSSHIEWQHSTDRGQTWSAPQAIDGPPGTSVRGAPVRTPDGTLILPATNEVIQQSLFFRAPDGATWSLASSVFTPPPWQNLQPALVVLADGRLLALLRNGGRGWLWHVTSADGGVTWSTPADSGFPNPAAPVALLRTAGGRLLLVFNDSPAVRQALSVCLSADDGLSWTAPRVIADGAGELMYPAATQAPDGRIHIVYSQDRAWIQHVTVNEAWIAGDWAAP